MKNAFELKFESHHLTGNYLGDEYGWRWNGNYMNLATNHVCLVNSDVFRTEDEVKCYIEGYFYNKLDDLEKVKYKEEKIKNVSH